jgi:tRNA A-37 threonylcarbamoyl transferase component Bud32
MRQRREEIVGSTRAARTAAGRIDVEERIAAFERAWHRGSPPAITEFLPSKGARARGTRELLLELVSVDLEYRWQPESLSQASQDALGARPTLADYAREVPAVGAVRGLPTWLVCEEYRVRQVWGDRPSHERFLSEYPEHATELAPLLQQIDRELAVEELPAAGSALPDQLETLQFDPRAPLPYWDYVLERLIGMGGMGKVYRARQKSLARTVAIKALRKSRQADPWAVEQFLQEARLVGGFRHPNIVSVNGLGRFPGGGYFLVMDFIDGQDLTRWQGGRPATVQEAMRITREVALAIAYAHAQGVVHCDLKPGNVLLASDGHVYVTDFGFARLVNPPTVSEPAIFGGTLPYLAPELLEMRAEAIGPAVDVYGLGGILYTLLSGRTPFEGDFQEIMQKISSAEPIQPPSRLRLDVPQELDAICMKCLHAAPEQRFARMAEIVESLAR